MTNIFWPIKIRSKEWGHSHLPTRDRYRWLVFRLACPTVGRMIPNCAQSNYLMLVFFKTKFWAFEMQMQSRRNDKSQRKRNEWMKEGRKEAKPVWNPCSRDFPTSFWSGFRFGALITGVPVFPSFFPFSFRSANGRTPHPFTPPPLVNVEKTWESKPRAKFFFFFSKNKPKKKVVFSQFRLLYNNNFNGFDDISFLFYFKFEIFLWLGVGGNKTGLGFVFRQMITQSSTMKPSSNYNNNNRKGYFRKWTRTLGRHRRLTGVLFLLLLHFFPPRKRNIEIIYDGYSQPGPQRNVPHHTTIRHTKICRGKKRRGNEEKDVI